MAKAGPDSLGDDDKIAKAEPDSANMDAKDAKDTAVDQTRSMRWYVLHTQSGKEKKALSYLQRHADAGEEWLGEVLVPSEEVEEIKDGQKRRSERKFFPGYVLIQMEMNDASWHMVKSTPGVLGFIGGGKGDKPQPIPQKEADAVLQLQRNSSGGGKATPKTRYEPGETVRVIDGPFNEFTGSVESVNYEKSTMQVAVMIFGRATPVDLAFDQVEKN